jgi:hypothetical protein
MMLPVLSELSELYRAADGAATACLLAKLGVEKSLMAKLEDTRQALLVGATPSGVRGFVGVGWGECECVNLWRRFRRDNHALPQASLACPCLRWEGF